VSPSSEQRYHLTDLTHEHAQVSGLHRITGQVEPTWLSSCWIAITKVYGTYRRTSSVNFWRIEELGIQDHPDLEVVEYDLTDIGTSIALVQRTQPDEIYNLAAQSFVGVSFDQPRRRPTSPDWAH